MDELRAKEAQRRSDCAALVFIVVLEVAGLTYLCL